MLFLTHLASKMRTARDGGGRAGIVLNGSPLFNGAAESGESEIRRHLLENDLVDAIVALPTSMFYNTGISTYIWILDNTKPPERVGTVQLIDGSSFFTKMRKNLGSKTREIGGTDRARIVRIYDALDDQAPEEVDHSLVFATTDFGYWTITVERPLRLSFECSPERIDAAVAFAEAPKGPLGSQDAAALRAALEAFGTTHDGRRWTDRAEFVSTLKAHLKASGLTVGTPALKALWLALSERDETATVCTDVKGNPEPDTLLRDTENIPFGWATPNITGDSRYGEAHRDEVIAAYVDHEVTPHLPDAWIDHTKTRVGYEIPFTRHFYRYIPPRPLEEIDADLNVLVKEIIGLLQEVEA